VLRVPVIGCAKDLIKSVARVVLDAKGTVIADVADFDEAVNAAHIALARQPGRNVSMLPEIRRVSEPCGTIGVARERLRAGCQKKFRKVDG
jgi:hypothetical protein